MKVAEISRNRSRVSLREVKEESYRALRQAGYSWGIAQAAGRCAGLAQVLFGTALEAIVRDASRFGVEKRKAEYDRKPNRVVIRARGMSWATVGPLAVAAALADEEPVIWVRGPVVGPELAAVIWDLKLTDNQAIVWGTKHRGGWNAFQVGKDGNIYRSSVAPERIGKVPFGAAWFVMVGAGEPQSVFLSKLSIQNSLLTAHREGVEIQGPIWHKIEQLAREFLVPE